MRTMRMKISNQFAPLYAYSGANWIGYPHTHRMGHICPNLTASIWSNHCFAVRIAGAAIIPSSRPLLRGLLRHSKTARFGSVLLPLAVCPELILATDDRVFM
eukprot:COSAG06_NODE_9203_length_1959_cov_6.024781_3_plen_102_part_00